MFHRAVCLYSTTRDSSRIKSCSVEQAQVAFAPKTVSMRRENMVGSDRTAASRSSLTLSAVLGSVATAGSEPAPASVRSYTLSPLSE